MDNFVGRPVLKLGMQKYFNRYSNSNTVLTDLVNCMNEAKIELTDEEAKGESKIDLIAWTDSWLKQQGPNTLIIESTKQQDGFKLNMRQGFANEHASRVYRE